MKPGALGSERETAPKRVSLNAAARNFKDNGPEAILARRVAHFLVGASSPPASRRFGHCERSFLLKNQSRASDIQTEKTILKKETVEKRDTENEIQTGKYSGKRHVEKI